ncbi:MAG: hypothetical protein ACRD12_10240 [Acidimicrobiales bacterium]
MDRRWRRAHVGGALAACTLVAAPGLARAGEAGEPVVFPNIQINQDFVPGRTHSEPQLSIDPTNPDVLAVAEAEFQTSDCHVFISRDGGRTWAPTAADPVPPEYKSCARPSFGPFIASKFGADGTLYVAATGAESATNSGPTDPYVARSSDLGATWQFTVIKHAEERAFKKPDGSEVRDVERFNYTRMATHPTDPNIVYAGFRRQGAFMPTSEVSERSVVAVSSDGGRSFGAPIDVFESFPLTDVKGTDAPAMSIDAKGTVYAFTKERPPAAPPGGAPTQDPLPLPPGPANTCKAASSAPNAPAWKPTPASTAPPQAGKPGAGARLLMSKSTDGGKTWQGSVVDTSGIVCVPCLTTPETAIDIRTGTVYVAFEQSDQGPPNPRDDRDIWFMKSSDGGATWTKKMRLNDDTVASRNPNYDQMFPAISVASNGRIDVAWWDFRSDGTFNPSGNGNTTRRDETCFDIYYTSSSDGGTTWAKNSRISDRTMNQNEGFAMNLAYDLRGPIGLASGEDEAYVAWSDSRNGRVDLPTEDLYFTEVSYEPETEPANNGLNWSVLLGIGIGAVGAAGAFLLAGRSRSRQPKPVSG